jgi:hypothetical protein
VPVDKGDAVKSEKPSSKIIACREMRLERGGRED